MVATHGSAIDELARHLNPIFESSPDGVYIWLDEDNKTCNEKLAAMFGYDVEEWRAVDDFAGTFIAPESRGFYVWHYQNVVLGLKYPATFRFVGQRKDGSTFEGETDIIPLTFDGHLIAYHFVREVRAG